MVSKASCMEKMKLIISALLCVFHFGSQAQNLYFPPLSGNTWDTLLPASLGWCQDKLDSLSDFLEVKNTKAFLLLKDGKIVMEKYYGNFTADSLWYWASAGKTLTAFVTGIAQQENYLSVDDTTSHYLGTGWTVCPPLKEEKITIRHQLTMTSGLNDAVPDHYCTLDTCLQYLADAGTRWAYHNGPYTLLDSVLEVACGQSLNSYITSRLKVPTGMTGAFFKIGYNNVFISNARSMARFGLLMLNQGNWNGNQILTDTAYYHQMITTSQSLNEAYGYLWWLNGKTTFMVPGLQFLFSGSLNPHAPADMYAALGKDGQIINVVPSMNLVYVRMGNAPAAGEVPVVFNDSVWVKLNDAMCNTSSVVMHDPTLAFRIYPNPARDGFKLANDHCRDCTLKISDSVGRTVMVTYHVATDSFISTAGMRSGMYYVYLISKDGVMSTQKLMVL